MKDVKYEKVVEADTSKMRLGVICLISTMFFAAITWNQGRDIFFAGIPLGIALVCFIDYFEERKVYWRKIK